LLANAQVYILGDKYDIPSLREVATAKYKEIVKDRWNNNIFAASAQSVYTSIVREYDMLKDVIIEAAHCIMTQLLNRGEFVRLLRSNGNMATDFPNAVIGTSQVAVQIVDGSATQFAIPATVLLSS
jgi:speckle-type POZ protein